MARIETHAPLLLMLVATLFALSGLVIGPAFQVDDAYIVARYAQNLVDHGRLTWNLDEAPVEGFTGYSLLIIMTIATALHWKPLVVATVTGIFAWFIGARLLYESHKPLGVSPLAGAITAALFLCAAEQTTHAMSSLETELFITLTIACAFVAMKRCQHEPGSGALWPLPIVTLAITLTRPEGVVIGSVFLLGVLIRERTAWRRWLPKVLGLFVLPFGALQIFRRLYFGSFLPNTYYAKALAPGESSVFLTSFFEHALDYFLPPLLVFFVVIAIARFSRTTILEYSPPLRDARRILFFGLVPSFLALGASYQRSDLVMNYSKRFAFHLFGLSCLLVLVIVGESFRYFQRLNMARPLKSTLFVVMSVALFIPFEHAFKSVAEECDFRRRYSQGAATHYRTVTDWLKREMPANATLAVYPDAGIVPYETSLRTIDFGKLNDVYLARPSTNPAAAIDYFFQRHPDALMISLKAGFTQSYDKTGDLLLADPRFSTYRLVMLSLNNNVGLAVFVPK
jgi:hypothetical protein